MKPLKSAKSNQNAYNVTRPRSSKTPKMSNPRSHKENDFIEMQPITGKLQQMDSLKQKSNKLDNTKKPIFKSKQHEICPQSGYKENIRHAKKKSVTEINENNIADKCIEQIEQELNQLKKITRSVKPSNNISPIRDSRPTEISKMLEILCPLITEYPEYPNLLPALSKLEEKIRKISSKLDNCNQKTDTEIQTNEDFSNKKKPKSEIIIEYEKKIAEMKITVYEMKERMSELENLCKTDSQNASNLEEELQKANEKINEQQKEIQKNYVILISKYNNRI